MRTHSWVPWAGTWFEQTSIVLWSPSLHQSAGQSAPNAVTAPQSAWYRPSLQQNVPNTHGCPSKPAASALSQSKLPVEVM